MDKASAEKLMQKRLQMIDNVVNFIPQEQVPIQENLFKWKLFDTELDPKPTPWEILNDWDLMEKVTREHQERYSPDMANDIGTRNNIPLSEALGFAQHKITDKENAVIQALDIDRFPTAESLVEYAENPVEYCWTKASKIIFKDGLTFGQIEDACVAVKNFNDYAARINTIMQDEYGLPSNAHCISISPAESACLYFRGLKNFSIDMRRKPQVIDEFCRMMTPAFLKPIEDACEQGRGKCAFTEWGVMLSHSVMNHKQFERFMWKGMWEEVFRILAEKHKTAIMNIEASTMPIADFLQDIPKGVACIYFEQDDPYDIRKALPNVAIAHYPTTYLSYKTKEEAVDKARELVENMGPGYMFCTNKMIEDASDQKRENVLAVYEYLRNH